MIMNFLQGMNQVITYLDSHLTEKIDYQKIYLITGYSYAHFQRIFSCIAGISVNDYIRRRRMTLAATDLKRGRKVIDVALKYGYETADSFGKVFLAFHGITPSQARNKDAVVKSFSPIRFHITVDGKEEISYRIESRQAMRIVGVMKHFRAPENSKDDVPVFWNELYGNGIYDTLHALSNDSPYGVHGFMKVHDEISVDYMIAAVTDCPIPEGMQEYIVPESTWAIFEQDGAVASTMESLWTRIFDEWLPSLDYSHARTMEIECFKHNGDKQMNGFKYEIWIPVKSV